VPLVEASISAERSRQWDEQSESIVWIWSWSQQAWTTRRPSISNQRGKL
jgi:hypothetical protein